MKSIALILSISIYTSCFGQSFVPLDSAIFYSITNSIHLEKLAFYSCSFTGKDDLKRMILSSEWHRKRFPGFFEHLDSNEQWERLLLSLDNDSSVIYHNQITSSKHDSLVIYGEEGLVSYRDSSGFNWKKYRKQSSSPEGFFQISRVLLSENKEIGVAKICRYNDSLAADSHVLLLEKKDGTWTVISTLLLWLS